MKTKKFLIMLLCVTMVFNLGMIGHAAVEDESVENEAAVTYYDESTGITYKAVGNNLFTGLDKLTRASDGGALSWKIVDKSAIDSSLGEGQYIHFTGSATGGNTANTMRTFYPIEGGKTYYVTNTIYNNTGDRTYSTDNAGMAAIIATGSPVYGTFSNLTIYSHVNYGGINSWSNESQPTYVGEKVDRYDYETEVGLNTVNAIIHAPEGAKNIMISYGAWGQSGLYYGDFGIYEVETEKIETRVTLSEDMIALKVGEAGTLTATVSAEEGIDKTVTWSSSNESVAIVTNGIVTAVGEGETVITASAAGMSAECSVIAVSSNIAAFGKCGETTYWTYDGAGTLVISGDGSVDIHTYSPWSYPWFSWDDDITDVVVEDGVTNVPHNMCADPYGYYYLNLKRVTVAGSVKLIDTEAFYETTVSEVTIENGVEVINDSAFSGCTSLKEIELPESITTINGYAFNNCTELTKITLGKELGVIKASAFNGCSSLENVYFNGTEAEWNEIEIGAHNESLLNATIYFADKEYATVAVNYFLDGIDGPVKRVEYIGIVGETVTTKQEWFNIDGIAYGGASENITVAADGNVVDIIIEAVENAAYASKTESYNATTGMVMTYPAASDRPAELAGTDALFAASWGDTRYGEMVFPVEVLAGMNMAKANLILTVADWINGYNQKFEIYLADAATYGKTNDFAGLALVGQGELGNKIGTVLEVELNLSNVDITDTNEVMFIIKITDGLGGVYGASFGDKAPFLVYELEGEPIEKITLDKEAVTLKEGDTATITATTLSGSAVDWYSEDESVATVTNGVVTAVGEGQTKISARRGNTVAYCIVTVSKKYYYVINSLTGNMPEEGSFYAEASVTKLAESDDVDCVVIAVFKDGIMMDRAYLKAKFLKGQNVIFGGYLQAAAGGEIRAFVWDEMENMVPLAESK